MKRFVRIVAVVLLLLAAGLLASSVGVVMPRSFRVVGPTGAPATAWAAYDYEGQRLNFVGSLVWDRPGGIVRADDNGAIRLPMLVYLKAPLDGWLTHRVRLIHTPALHATLHEHRPAGGTALKFQDYTAAPAAWGHTFDEIYSLVAYDLMLSTHERYAVEPKTVKELARLVVDDYRALLAAHGETPRIVPEDIPGHLQFASDEDRAEWRERMRREIEREPTWGAYLERRYAKRIAELEITFGF
jgi:hypothetical protein